MPFANILYREFREYLVEIDDPWEDKRFHDKFDSFVQEHNIKIEYKYIDTTVGSDTSLLKWRCVNDKDEPGTKFRTVRFTGSSRFAMWWCGIIGDDPDEDREFDGVWGKAVWNFEDKNPNYFEDD